MTLFPTNFTRLIVASPSIKTAIKSEFSKVGFLISVTNDLSRIRGFMKLALQYNINSLLEGTWSKVRSWYITTFCSAKIVQKILS